MSELAARLWASPTCSAATAIRALPLRPLPDLQLLRICLSNMLDTSCSSPLLASSQQPAAGSRQPVVRSSTCGFGRGRFGVLLHPLVNLRPAASHAFAMVFDDESHCGVVKADERAVFFLAEPVLQ